MWTYRREAARIVVLDERDRVLLIRARDPARPSRGQWWEIPGGGIEAGESSASAAARELFEETGIRADDVGPALWQQHARFTFAGIRFDQFEHVHVARVSAAPEPGDYRPGGLEAMEALAFSAIGWWSVDELDSMTSTGGLVLPPWLGEQLRRYLEDGPPAEPIYLGELGDLG